MTPTTDSLVIETQLVRIPNVGPMFRRVYRTTDGEELKVEYMEVHEADAYSFPDEWTEEPVSAMASQ